MHHTKGYKSGSGSEFLWTLLTQSIAGLGLGIEFTAMTTYISTPYHTRLSSGRIYGSWAFIIPICNVLGYYYVSAFDLTKGWYTFFAILLTIVSACLWFVLPGEELHRD